MNRFIELRNGFAADRLAEPEFQENTSSTRYVGQWALETLNVHQAHAALAVIEGDMDGQNVKPGAGVTVGVMDSGVDLTHRELVGASITETFLQNLPDETRADYQTNGGYSHGTAVTSIMAVQPNDAGFLGIAWGANFKMFTAPIGSHIPENDIRRRTFDWDDAYRDVLASGVDIVNASYGFTGTFVENYTVNQLRAAGRLGSSFEVIAQRGVADPSIFVWIAGNDHGNPCDRGDENCFADSSSTTGFSYRATSPGPEAGAVAKLPELQGHNVVTVAVGRDGRIADFSNRCGIAGPWCIAAPGVDVTAALFDSVAPSPDAFRVLLNSQGTSAAAPMVSGGLALMKHFFRGQLSNRELLTRLFATANKNGIYGSSSIYGQGLMDLGAAVSPVDNAQVMTNSRVGTNGQGGHSIQTTQLRLGRAFGNSLSHSLAGREIAAFDALGAPFWFGLSGLAGTAYQPSSLGRLHSLMAPGKQAGGPPARGTRMTRTPYALAVHQGAWRVGLYESPATAESSLLNLAGNAATVTFKAQNGFETTAFATFDPATSLTRTDFPPRQRTSDVGALLAWRPPDTPVGVRVGWLREGNSLLGSRATGAFGRLSATTCSPGSRRPPNWGAGAWPSTPRSVWWPRTWAAGSSTACCG